MKRLNHAWRLKAIILTIVLGYTAALWAENYPYRSDFLWLTIPDHANWLYQVGEQAKVEVSFTWYGIPQNVDYMKHVDVACVRAVDYLCSLPDWDGKNVFVQGGSQGGALSIITPINEHWTSDTTNYNQMLWLKKHLR